MDDLDRQREIDRQRERDLEGDDVCDADLRGLLAELHVRLQDYTKVKQECKQRGQKVILNFKESVGGDDCNERGVREMEALINERLNLVRQADLLFNWAKTHKLVSYIPDTLVGELEQADGASDLPDFSFELVEEFDAALMSEAKSNLNLPIPKMSPNLGRVKKPSRELWDPLPM